MLPFSFLFFPGTHAATKKTFNELYHKFKRATEGKHGPIALSEEEMSTISPDKKKVVADRDIQLDDDDDDVPLERNAKLFAGSKGAYQPVRTDGDNQRLIAREASSQDDDGL